VIDGDNSVGTPISPIFPLNLDSALASQVKGRTGVQLGSKKTLSAEDEAKLGPRHRGTWNGNIGGRSVVVRIWETDA
jgi:hypothetical protein